MFGEFSAMTWLGSAIMLAIGGGAGFFVARQIKDKRTLELEQQLDAAQNKLSEYQDDVNRHFLKTSLLFNKLTDNYKEVYEHLATGAQKLCNQKPLTTALDLPEAKILSAAVSADAATATIAEEKIETDTISPAPTETEHDDAMHLGVESIVAAEEIALAHAEAASAGDADQTEQRTTEQATEVPMAAPIENMAKSSPDETPTTATASENKETETTHTQPADDKPTISAEELKALETHEKEHEEDVHLGAESTPGVELKHHKTHPSIH